MVRGFKVTVRQEGETFLAECLEVEVTGEGSSRQEALMDLHDSLLVYFEELRPFLKVYLDVVET